MDRPGVVHRAALIAQEQGTRKAGTLVFPVIHGFDRRRAVRRPIANLPGLGAGPAGADRLGNRQRFRRRHADHLMPATGADRGVVRRRARHPPDRVGDAGIGVRGQLPGGFATRRLGQTPHAGRRRRGRPGQQRAALSQRRSPAPSRGQRSVGGVRAGQRHLQHCAGHHAQDQHQHQGKHEKDDRSHDSYLRPARFRRNRLANSKSCLRPRAEAAHNPSLGRPLAHVLLHCRPR